MSILRRLASGWDLPLPLLGFVLLFLEVTPRPVFGWNAESVRVLVQFPLVGAAFLAARERRFRPAVAIGICLALVQGWPGARALLRGVVVPEAIFPCAAWAALLASYLHPVRREVYFADPDRKETP